MHTCNNKVLRSSLCFRTICFLLVFRKAEHLGFDSHFKHQHKNTTKSRCSTIVKDCLHLFELLEPLLKAYSGGHLIRRRDASPSPNLVVTFGRLLRLALTPAPSTESVPGVVSCLSATKYKSLVIVAIAKEGEGFRGSCTHQNLPLRRSMPRVGQNYDETISLAMTHKSMQIH